MDGCSEDSLLAIEQNSNKVTYLKVGAHHLESGRNLGVFNNSPDSDDYDRLGTDRK